MQLLLLGSCSCLLIFIHYDIIIHKNAIYMQDIMRTRSSRKADQRPQCIFINFNGRQCINIRHQNNAFCDVHSQQTQTPPISQPTQPTSPPISKETTPTSAQISEQISATSQETPVVSYNQCLHYIQYSIFVIIIASLLFTIQYLLF